MKYSWLVMVFGYWGRGQTIKEAAEQVKKSGAFGKDKVVIMLVIGDDKPNVNEGGYILREGGSSTFMIKGGIKLRDALKMESAANIWIDEDPNVHKTEVSG